MAAKRWTSFLACHMVSVRLKIKIMGSGFLILTVCFISAKRNEWRDGHACLHREFSIT